MDDIHKEQPAYIPYSVIDSLWSEYQKEPSGMPESLIGKINLPNGIEAMSISSDKFGEERRLIKTIFSRLDNKSLDNATTLIGEKIDIFRKLQVDMVKQDSINEETARKNIETYIVGIANIILEEILVKDIGPLQLTLINRICAVREKTDKANDKKIPDWKYELGTILNFKVLKPFLFDDIMSEKVIFEMAGYLADIRYADSSQEVCPPEVRTKYSKWYDSLLRTIKLINMFTRPPDDYYYFDQKPICKIIDQLLFYLDSTKNGSGAELEGYMIDSKRELVTEIIYGIVKENNDLMLKMKNNSRIFNNLYDTLKKKQSSYSDTYVAPIMDILNNVK